MSSGKKALALLILTAAAFSGIFGQSAVDAAKKEKERRAKLKGAPVVVVTNADLARNRKKPSLGRAKPESSAEAEAAAPGETEAATKAPTAIPAPASGPENKPIRSEALNQSEERRAELQSRYDRAKERTELLNLKMVALNQQLTTFNSMTPKEVVQKAISETYTKLLEAQAEETKAKEELEKFLNQAASASVPSIWIK